MAKGKCKRPVAQSVPKTVSTCGNNNTPPVTKPVPAPNYELLFEVVEAVSGNKVPNAIVKITDPENLKDTYTCDGQGLYRKQLDAGLQFLLEVDVSGLPQYTLKPAMQKVNAVTQAEGGTPVKIEVEKTLLEITSADPHFAPTGKDDAENLQIKYNINQLSARKVSLIIQTGTDLSIIYQRELTSSERADGGSKILKWDGKTNCTSGPLQHKLASPMFGPFFIFLQAEGIDEEQILYSNISKTNVLFHSVKLKHGSYLEDPGAEPARIQPVPASTATNWPDHIKWVQYRLNKLGYFAGKVDGSLNAQTKGAIKRYTYEMINHDESGDATDAAFLNNLAGDTLKVDLFEKPAAITDKGTDSKIYIQNNYYYHTEGPSGTDNYLQVDGHYAKESSKLDRFEYPIEAEIKLKSRAGADGINAPQSLTGLQVKWTITDPDEDVSLIPAYDGTNAPSSARKYVRNVLQNVKALPGVLGDNCPEICGGVPLSETYFYEVLPGYPVTAGVTRASVLSGICTDTTKTKMSGKSGILFKGSTMGGDDFIVQAEISFDGQLNAVEAKKAYDALPQDDRMPKTGKMTQWRKRRVVNVIDWMPQLGPAVNWSETKDAYKAAFIDFDVSGADHVKLDQVVTSANDAKPYLDTVAARMNLNPSDKLTMRLNPDNMLPFTFVKQPGENTAAFKLRISGRVADFNNQVTRITLGDGVNVTMGDWLRRIVHRTKRPGIIVVRGLVFKGIDVKTSVLNTEKDFARNEGSTNTGVGGGLAYISESYRKKLKDGFLISHEIGHCFYLLHPFDGASNTDDNPKKRANEHDMDDKNCMMYYLHSDQSAQRPSGRTPATLSPGSAAKPLFCGKCLLKLRGWKVNGATPVSAVLPGNSKGSPAFCNARMQFTGYYIKTGSYMGRVSGLEKQIILDVGATDPANPKIALGPYSFLHRHVLTWESSDGNMASLAKYKTRERITFNQPTQQAPFNEAADPDQDFAQYGADGDIGSGTDDHSIRWPALICAPGATGTVTGVQKYQYIDKNAPNGTQWTDIPEATFNLEKTVYQSGNDRFLKFRKTNGAGNPNFFDFTVCYKVFPAPVSAPVLKPYDKAVSRNNGKPVQGVATIWANGDRQPEYGPSAERATTLDELGTLGYLAPEPWP